MLELLSPVLIVFFWSGPHGESVAVERVNSMTICQNMKQELESEKRNLRVLCIDGS